jgi:hypothetical protein
MMDSRLYEVDLGDSHLEKLSVSIIAESLSTMVDPKGREHELLDEISGYHQSPAGIEKGENWPKK